MLDIAQCQGHSKVTYVSLIFAAPCSVYVVVCSQCQILMVYSHWLGPEPGQRLGRKGCMVIIRTFHTAPEQGQGRTSGTFSGPEEWVWYSFFRS